MFSEQSGRDVSPSNLDPISIPGRIFGITSVSPADRPQAGRPQHSNHSPFFARVIRSIFSPLHRSSPSSPSMIISGPQHSIPIYFCTRDPLESRRSVPPPQAYCPPADGAAPVPPLVTLPPPRAPSPTIPLSSTEPQGRGVLGVPALLVQSSASINSGGGGGIRGGGVVNPFVSFPPPFYPPAGPSPVVAEPLPPSLSNPSLLGGRRNYLFFTRGC